jgi:hypothetical protein
MIRGHTKLELTLCALAMFVVPANAWADTETCARDAVETQELRDRGALVEAKAKAAACVAVECPDAIRKDCGTWMSEIEARIPTVLVRVTNSEGLPMEMASVAIDGRAIALDGRAIVLNPGRHTFTASAGGSTELTTVLGEGERLRTITLAISSPEPSHANRTASFVLGGIGAAALLTGVVFEVLGTSAWSRMQSSCKPNCPADDIDRARTQVLVGDIALASSVVLLGIATYLYLTQATTPARAAVRMWSGRLH